MNIFKSLFFLLSGGDDVTLKNKKALRLVAKEITRNKYHQFYGVKFSHVRHRFGVFFYDIYTALYSTGIVMQHAEKSGILREIIIEHFLSSEALEAHQRLVLQ
jgi:hypothetical protein